MMSEHLTQPDPGETAIYEVTPPTEIWVVTMPNDRVKAFYDREAAETYALHEVQNWKELGFEADDMPYGDGENDLIFKVRVWTQGPVIVRKVVVT